MGDIQIRYAILHDLKLYNNESPHGFLDKETLLERLKLNDVELYRNIKYLEDKIEELEMWLEYDSMSGEGK